MKKPFEWIDSHPVISIIGYAGIIAGAVFAFSKFVLFENVQTYYDAQLETKEAVISQRDAVIQQKDTMLMQYEARITFLENENSQLRGDISKYQEWLQNSPETLLYVEKENEQLRKQIEEMSLNDQTLPSTGEFKYTKSYDSIDENAGIVDAHTGIVVAMTDIDIDYEGELAITIPGSNTEIIRNATAGLTREYSIDGAEYQVALVMVDFVSNKYSVVIRQI